MKRVLNEDGFQEEIVALANVGLEQQISSMKAEGTSINSTYYIHKAVVKEVGLSGIVFRVKAANTSNSALESKLFHSTFHSCFRMLLQEMVKRMIWMLMNYDK